MPFVEIKSVREQFTKAYLDIAKEAVSSLEDDADGNGSSGDDYSHISSHIKRYVYQELPRYRAMIDSIYPYIQRGKVLDIGVYPGVFTAALSQMGVDIIGIDVEPTRIPKTIRSRISIIKMDVEKRYPLPLESASYDSILFLALLEHMRINPLAVLREFKRILRGGGKLIIQTPSLSYWGCRLSVLRGRSFDESPFSAYSFQFASYLYVLCMSCKA
ncbi:methyltransferase type 11, partial [Candidatus Magnetoovum chiemensis]